MLQSGSPTPLVSFNNPHHYGKLKMAKHVVISTIGAAPPHSTPGHTLEQSVADMAAFWEGKLAQVWPDWPDLVVLPEMCDNFADFTSAQLVEFVQARGDQLLDFFRAQARLHRCYIAYPSLRFLEDGTRHNSLTMIGRDGEIAGIYDKNHVVISETTEFGVQYGEAAPLIHCDFGTVGGVICFDLNFDDLRLHYKAAAPDLLLFPSIYHGGLQQPYWAFSCRAHFVSAIGHPGLQSCITSPTGQTLASTTVYQDYVTASVNLDCCLAHLDFNRDALTALKAHYGREVVIADPDLLGSVLITSESPEKSALDMAREFNIELLDDYLARSIQHREGHRAGLST